MSKRHPCTPLALSLVLPFALYAQEAPAAKRTEALDVARNLLTQERSRMDATLQAGLAHLEKELEKLKNDKAKREAAMDELTSQGAVSLGAGGVEASPMLCLGARLLLEYPIATHGCCWGPAIGSRRTLRPTSNA